MKQAPTGLVSCCSSFLGNVSCLFTSSLRSLSFSISFLSLSSIHILRIESFFFFHPYELEIQSYSRRTRPRVSGRSRAGVSCFVSNSFFNSFDYFCSSWSSWRRGSISRPSERMPYILPQDHGVLASMYTTCRVKLLTRLRKKSPGVKIQSIFCLQTFGHCKRISGRR